MKVPRLCDADPEEYADDRCTASPQIAKATVERLRRPAPVACSRHPSSGRGGESLTYLPTRT